MPSWQERGTPCITITLSPIQSVTMKKIILRHGKQESLKRFHPWIFSGAIASKPSDLKEGDTVVVYDSESNLLGTGHWQPGSIAVRMLTFGTETVDDDFWKRRIQESWSLRESVGLVSPPYNTIFRLVHGEGDRLPGLIVDVYGHTAVMQAHSVGMHLHRMAIANAIMEASQGYIHNVFEKSETTLPHWLAKQNEENGFLIGHDEGNTAQENGLRFLIDWQEGQKTGFFVDQRENRLLLEKYAKGRTVLNMFCYTGGFSVYALRGGATTVHSVDSSEKAIALTQQNVAQNFGEEESRHQAIVADAFKYLDNTHETYDLIVLDPPAFAKHKDAIRNAIKGYTRLNANAFRKIKKGGILFTFSCSQAVSKEQFRLAVFTAAAQSGRYVRILHQLHQPADHPINIYHPEGEYLKGLVLEVE